MRIFFPFPSFFRSGLSALSVCFFSLSLSAQTAISTGPFCDSCVLTNITFVDQESYDQYRSNSIERVDFALARCDSLGGALSSARGNITASMLYQSLAKRNALDAEALCDEPSESDIRSEIGYSIAQMTISMDYGDRALDDISKAQDTNALVRTELQNVRTALETGATEYNGTFATSCESSGGGCSCPDYTPLLQNISGYLSSVNSWLSNLMDLWEQDITLIADMLYYFFEQAELASYGSFHTDLIGYNFGHTLGTVVSNLYSFTWSLENYSRSLGLGTDSMVLYGTPFSRDLWNFLLEPYAQLLYANTDSPNTQNRMVNSIRDYYLRDWTYIYPTNTMDNPLWVSVMSNSVGSSEVNPVFVNVVNDEAIRVLVDSDENTPVHVTVDGLGDSVVNVFATNNFADITNMPVTVLNYEDFAYLTNVIADALGFFNDQVTQRQEDLDSALSDFKDDDDQPDVSYSDEDEYFGVFKAFQNMFTALRNLVPPRANPPDFYVDYTFQFQGSGVNEGGSVEVIYPIGVDALSSPLWHDVAHLLRGFFQCIWLLGCLYLAIQGAAWVFRVGSSVLAVSWSVISGNLDSIANLLPKLSEAVVGK